jgi:iron complex outermembrane receptor protein
MGLKIQAQLDEISDTLSLNEVFEMDLAELQNIKITGAFVRELGLGEQIQTENFVKGTNINTPFSVEIIHNKTIDARGLKNIIEATNNTTGVISGDSPAEPYSFSIRGFSRDYVKILYDGISLGIPTLNTRPLGTSNLERIEILRGPVSLTGGQGAAGGTINIISKKPKLTKKHHGRIDITYGSFNTSLLNAEVSGPLSKKFAYRADINRQASKGWVDRSESEVISFNTAFLWRPTTKLESVIAVTISKDKLPGYWGTPLIPYNQAKEPLDVVNSDDNLVIDGITKQFNYNVSDHTINSTSIHPTFDIKWKISKQLTNKTKLYYYRAIRQWENAESYFYDTLSEKVIRDRLSVDHFRELWGMNTSFLYESKIAGKKNLLGIHLEYSQNNFSRGVGFLNATIDSVDLIDPEPGYFGIVGVRDDFFNEGNLALVVQDRFEIISGLNIDITGRYERITIKRERYDFQGIPRKELSIDESYLQGSLRLGITYMLNKRMAIYGNYSYSHGPFAGDIATTNLSNIATFKPSDIFQKEIGYKASFIDAKIELTIALYDIFRTVDIQTDSNTISKNEQKSKGLDIALNTSPFKNFKLGGSFAYNNSQFDSYFDPDFEVDVSGNIPINAPDFVASLWCSYSNILGVPLELGIGSKYISERQANNLNTVLLKEYSLYNVFAAYTIKRLRLAFHIRNLTNIDYVPWSDQYYPYQLILGAPRSYELSLILSL